MNMKILFLGDFYYDTEKEQEDIKDIIEYFNKNQYQCVLNLEGALVKTDTPNHKKRGPNLAHSSTSVEILKKMNTIGVCLANNHMMDYEEKGLEKTIVLLEENQIKHCGAGKNLNEAIQPMFLDGNIYICNYGWNIEETQYATNTRAGCAPKKENVILKQIENLRKNKKAKIIVQLHWGFEYNLFPMPLDRKLAYKIIDAGADMVIGHHPHCIQCFETYKEKPIYYSLGNFYFGSRRDRFSNKIFHCEQKKDRCNYGVGVVYDSETNKIEKELVFYYDKEMNVTKIQENADIEQLMPNITNLSQASTQYYELAKSGNENITPILKGKYIQDYLKIGKLKTYYFLKKTKRIISKR